MPCEVILEDSFERAFDRMTEFAQAQVAVVIMALGEDCQFEGDFDDYIVEKSMYLTACEHVQGWGWTIFWYREGDTLIVNADQSTRERLIAKKK